MNRFFASFISGTQELIRGILAERLGDPRISAMLDGGVEFETGLPYSDLNLFCFNNIFRVLCRLDIPKGAPEDALDGCLKRLLREPLDWAPARENSGKIKTFRLVISRENRLAAADRELRGKLEKKIAQLSGLRVDRSRPDTEFWVLSRSEGFCYFLKRLSRHTAYDKLLSPGELHPELAYMMCWLSRPKFSDVVLDPFCGFGSIPKERCRRFPFSRVYAFDNDPAPLSKTREKLGKRENVTVERQDALALDRVLPPASVDAVITDPPWGLFRDVGMELSDFYRRMLEQLSFVLKPGGRLVLLTAARDELLQAAGELPCLRPEAEHRILVSGKKCGLYLFSKC